MFTVGDVLRHKQQNMGKKWATYYHVSVSHTRFTGDPDAPWWEDIEYECERYSVDFVGNDAQEMAESCFKAVAGGLLEYDVSDAITRHPFYGGMIEIHDEANNSVIDVFVGRICGYI